MKVLSHDNYTILDIKFWPELKTAWEELGRYHYPRVILQCPICLRSHLCNGDWEWDNLYCNGGDDDNGWGVSKERLNSNHEIHVPTKMIFIKDIKRAAKIAALFRYSRSF